MSLTDLIAAKAADAVADQPWYRAKSNTIVAAISGVAMVLTWVATTSLGLPGWVQIAAGSTAAVLGVVATRLTRNGLTTRTNADLVAQVAPVAEAEVRRQVEREAYSLSRHTDARDAARVAAEAARRTVEEMLAPGPVLDALDDALAPLRVGAEQGRETVADIARRLSRG